MQNQTLFEHQKVDMLADIKRQREDLEIQEQEAKKDLRETYNKKSEFKVQSEALSQKVSKLCGVKQELKTIEETLQKDKAMLGKKQRQMEEQQREL